MVEPRADIESIRGGSHLPVMCAEVVSWLDPRPGGRYLDGTFGGGGYAEAILARATCTLFAIDRDPDAIARGAALAARHPGALCLIEGNFGDMVALLERQGVRSLDGVVLDLGVSSFQLDQAERGFSFRNDGPLDMRMGRSGPTAADLVNTMAEDELADVLFSLGDERRSRRVASAIVAARRETPIATTGQLAAIVRRVVPGSRDGIDPATRSFQALRIRVNDELGEIERGLAAAASLLGEGGRLVVVSFHSLEDRIVKRFMLDAAGQAPLPSRHVPAGAARAAAGFSLLTRRAERPTEAEMLRNPRARSAKLRALNAWHSGRGERLMIRPFTCLTVLLAASSGLYLYSEKHKTTLLDGRIRAVVADTDRIEDRTSMLRAEWALLNQPDRLQALAARFLPQLQPMAPTQFVPVAELDRHLPAEGPPPDAAVPVVPAAGVLLAAGSGAPAAVAGTAATVVAIAAPGNAAAAAKPAAMAKPEVVRVAMRVRHAPSAAHRTIVAALAPRLPSRSEPSLVHQVASFAPPAPMLAASWRQAPAAPVFAGSALGMAHAAMAPPMAAR